MSTLLDHDLGLGLDLTTRAAPAAVPDGPARSRWQGRCLTAGGLLFAASRARWRTVPRPSRSPARSATTGPSSPNVGGISRRWRSGRAAG